MKSFFPLIFFLCTLLVTPCFGWGEGHDAVGTLEIEFFSGDVGAFFSSEDKKYLITWAHYPDLPQKTMEEMVEIIGPDDATVLKHFGVNQSMGFHSVQGRAAGFLLLCRAFREKNGRKAAFYTANLSHSIADQAAINHTPLGQFVTYSKFPHVNYKSKNEKDFGAFFRRPNLASAVREGLKEHEQKMLASSFEEMLFQMLLVTYDLNRAASQLENAILYGTPEEFDAAMAQLGVLQCAFLLDFITTAYALGNSDEKLEIPEDWMKTFSERAEKARDALTPETDAVFHDLYTFERIPGAPTVGIVVEPYSDFHVSELAYAGRMLAAASGRTLHAAGMNILPISVVEIKNNGLPSPADVPVLVIFPGKYRVAASFTAALKAYRDAGGKFLWAAGTDPAGVTCEIAENLQPRSNEELPTSTLWGVQNEEIYGKMSLTFAPELQEVVGKQPFFFKTNPNFDGFAKPQCQFSVKLVPGIRPLAFLNNGTETFCVAAAGSDSVWLPEYLVLPFLFSEDMTTDWNAMTLDSFSAPLVIWSVRTLLP